MGHSGRGLFAPSTGEDGVQLLCTGYGVGTSDQRLRSAQLRYRSLREAGRGDSWWEIPLQRFRPGGESGASAVQGVQRDGGV